MSGSVSNLGKALGTTCQALPDLAESARPRIERRELRAKAAREKLWAETLELYPRKQITSQHQQSRG